MGKRNFTVSDDYGVVATFWTAQVAFASVRRWTLAGHKALRVHDNETGELLIPPARRAA
jgi:hypothetical protein